MAKRQKLTRAMKIAASREAESKARQEAAALRRLQILGPENIAAVVKLLEDITSDTRAIESYMECSCSDGFDFDGSCSCDYRRERAEARIHKNRLALVPFSGAVIAAAEAQIAENKRLARVKHERFSQGKRIEKGDLCEVLPKDISYDGYCSRKYWEWENNIAAPALLALGYKEPAFVDGERDSCGPLSRIVTVLSADEAEVHEFFYG